MNFKNVILALVDFFGNHQMDYALAGAFALKAYGYLRATQDVDFVVRQEEQSAIIQFLESLGFETLYRSTGYSNHGHILSELGQVDFVYVTGKTAATIFANAQKRLILREVMLPVVAPIHLVAMKVFAMKNDPRRRLREMADIEYLMNLPEVPLEHVKIYFGRHGLSEDFERIIAGKETNGDS